MSHPNLLTFIPPKHARTHTHSPLVQGETMTAVHQNLPMTQSYVPGIKQMSKILNRDCFLHPNSSSSLDLSLRYIGTIPGHPSFQYLSFCRCQQMKFQTTTVVFKTLFHSQPSFVFVNRMEKGNQTYSESLTLMVKEKGHKWPDEP